MRDSADSVAQLVQTWTLDEEVVGLNPTLNDRSCLEKGQFALLSTFSTKKTA